MLRGFWAVYRRELWSIWVTPLAWVLLVVFLLLQGASFSLVVTHFASFADLSVDQGPIQVYLSSAFVHMSLLIICPALSMRSFADERRTGTIEPLLTAPTTPLAIVAAKYGCMLTTFAMIWLPTLLYAVILRNTGVVVWPVLLAGYLGVLLMGAMYLAVGLLMSALTSSQLVAALLTTLTVFGLFIVGLGEQVFDAGFARDLCAHLSLLAQLDEFTRGIVDLRRLIFDVSFTWLCLLMATRTVESWRWAS